MHSFQRFSLITLFLYAFCTPISISVAEQAFSPEVQMDLLTAEIAAALERDDHKAVVAGIDKARKMNVAMPPKLIFIEARSRMALEQYIEAQPLLEKYINEAGRKGKYYQDALKLYITVKEKAKVQAEAKQKAREAAAKKAEEEQLANLKKARDKKLAEQKKQEKKRKEAAKRAAAKKKAKEEADRLARLSPGTKLMMAYKRHFKATSIKDENGLIFFEHPQGGFLVNKSPSDSFHFFDTKGKSVGKWQLPGNERDAVTVVLPDGRYLIETYSISQDYRIAAYYFNATGKLLSREDRGAYNLPPIDANNLITQENFMGLHDMGFATNNGKQAAAMPDGGLVQIMTAGIDGDNYENLVKRDRHGTIQWIHPLSKELGVSGAWSDAIKVLPNGTTILAYSIPASGDKPDHKNLMEINANGELATWMPMKWTFSVADMSVSASQEVLGAVMAGTNHDDSQSAMIIKLNLDKQNNQAQEKWFFKPECWPEDNGYGKCMQLPGAINSKMTAMEPVKGGGYLVAGWMQSESAYAMALWMVDENGKLLWQRLYNTDSFLEPEAIIASKDGKYVISGSRLFNDEDADKLMHSVFMLKVDKQGVPVSL